MINPILFFLCHLVPDFWLQSDWMAMNKFKQTWLGVLACLVHVLIYTACFLLLTTSWKALLFIGATHFIIDHWPVIVRRLIWWKNHLGPTMKYPPYRQCDATGYYDDSPYTSAKQADVVEKNGMKWTRLVGHIYPEWWGTPRHYFVTIWLYIVSDNTLHLIFNYIALTLLV